MKKVLLATSALMLVAGAAAAEVKITGYAEMGVFGVNSDDNANDVDTQFHTDIDATFKMSGETDGGIAFGADVDIDEGIADGGDAVDVDSEHGGAAFFVKAGAATLSMGDVNGAVDQYFKEYIGVHGGSLQDNEETVAYNGFSRGGENFDVLDDGLDGLYDGQIARLDYSLDAISFGVSVELDDANDGGDPLYGIGAKYSAELGGLDLTLGAGYQTVEKATGDQYTALGVSLEVGLAGGLDLILAYGNGDLDAASGSAFSDDTVTGYGIGLGYSFDAVSLGVSYGTTESDTLDQSKSGYAITAGYDLGGGLALQAGYGFNDDEVADEEYSTYSFGVAMSF